MALRSGGRRGRHSLNRAIVIAFIPGGLFDIVGTASATTSITTQGSGTYSFSVSGGTLNANYYKIRNTDGNGLNLSGSPTVSSLSNGDFQLGVNSGTMINVTGSVINANPSLTSTER